MLDNLIELDGLWRRICYNFGASKEECEDIIQDMYLKLMTDVNLDRIKYGDNGINRYYVYKVLKSLFINVKRDKLANNSYQLNEELNVVGEDYIEAKDQAFEDIISDIKAELSTKRRSLQRLFELYYKIPLNSSAIYQGENLSYRDIARESNISLSTVFNDMKELKSIISIKREDIQDYYYGDYDKL